MTPTSTLAKVREALEAAYDRLYKDHNIIYGRDNTDVLVKVHQALALLTALEQMGEWQDISTAPRDGTRVLVINNGEGGYHTGAYDIGVAAWEKCLSHFAWGSQACCDGVSYFTPTHWMPLPAPPMEGDKG